ncbi:hypothetical protein HBH53_201010 [Parastagonospora nodorum]|nr:hypothetical protein HBH53_201010 [Parastagonospora nodorum]KAH4060075.1 hypothetical protein HBH50_226410 [Parastagonospora nodorum]KAH4077942.1 hypothetical protein HBH48_236200 [Parastagonospora nodorum]KAH5355038.1 hypothetical protein HBI33_207470 [Parastagonospora nodorum]KAH5497254.1 hypothetical protein HBI52_189250 [Parastagonospora nodorum]
MSETSNTSGRDPSWFGVDAMRAINAPKVLGGTLSAPSQQTNQPSTRANNEKPLFGLGVSQTKSKCPTFGPGGVRRSKANMTGPFGGGAFAAPTSALVDKTGKLSVELFGGPGAPQEKIREQPSNVPENIFGRLGRPTPLFAGTISHERTHPANTFGGLFEQNNPGCKVPAVRVYAHEAVDLGFDTIAITADKKHCGQKTFAVHKSLVMNRSVHLKIMLREDPDLKNITLDTTDPQALALYIQHIYFSRLPTKPYVDNSDSPNEYSLLVKLYVLGTELQDKIAKNAAVDALFAKAHEGTDLPSADHISILYGGTKGTCPARKLMVDIYTSMATNASMQDQTFPSDFMVDLAMSLVAGRSVLFKPATPKAGAAIYHEE